MKVPAAFFEVSPHWAKAISEAKTVKELSGNKDSGGSVREFGDRSIQNAQSCIVGEAHHNTFKWGSCQECDAFSSRFGDILTGELDTKGNRKQQLVQNITDFTSHWREEHNPLVHLDIETEDELPVIP